MKYVGECTPAWSFGPNGKKTWLIKQQTNAKEEEYPYPGPGYYKNDGEKYYQRLNNPITRLSQEVQPDLKNKVKLGPGYYEVLVGITKPDSKPQSFSKNKKFDNPKIIPYGISDLKYSYNLTKNKLSASFGFKPREVYDSEIPGPGAYTPKLPKNEIGAKIGKLISKKRSSSVDPKYRKKSTPGPGSYLKDENNVLCHRKEDRYQSKVGIMGKPPKRASSEIKKRPSSKRYSSPGVGTYEQNYNTIQYSISRLRKRRKKGKNNPKKVNPRLAKSSDNVYKKVGPQDYSPNYTLTKEQPPGYSFGNSAKLWVPKTELQEKGYRDVSDLLKKLKVKEIRAKNAKSKKEKHLKSIVTGFSSGKRCQLFNKQSDHLLDINIKRDITQGLKYSIQKKTPWVAMRDDTRYFPGPGAYKDNQGFSQQEIQKLKGPRFFKTSKKVNLIKGGRDAAPGPGHYEIIGSLGEDNRGAFGTSKRTNFEADPEDLGIVNSGPGMYDLKSTVPQIQPWEEKKMKNRGISKLS